MADGSHVFFTTKEPVTGDDADGSQDIAHLTSSSGALADGSHIFFTTAECHP